MGCEGRLSMVRATSPPLILPTMPKKKIYHPIPTNAYLDASVQLKQELWQ
jgi:hypothetical protein